MKVLIVEDCPELSFFWSEALSDMFKERIVASSTREAMTCLLRSSYDLVILDLFVEDGPTISLSDWIAMRSPDVPILMITGSHTMAHGEHTDLARGVTWLLRKPIKTDELRAMAAHLIGSRRNQPDAYCVE